MPDIRYWGRLLANYLDELDQQIIGELRRDGRQANTEIARRLGVSEATIRNRIQRLVGEGILRIAAHVNLSRLGYELDVLIGVHCDAGRALEVGSLVAAMEQVRYLAFVTGRYDLHVSATFRTRDELSNFLVERLGKIPGVHRTETLHVLQVLKRTYYYTEEHPAG